ncbi:MAG: DUF1961 family protein [Candidatus Moranbacteria bacterium]|nr:DUF1961 family protein [Candidatus Moranbacteria bacterium]
MDKSKYGIENFNLFNICSINAKKRNKLFIIFVVSLFLPLINSNSEDKMDLMSVKELTAFANKLKKDYEKKTGKTRHLGDNEIPEFIFPKGKILYEDNFTNFNNWHHEGIGKLVQNETGIMQLDCIGSKQGAEGCNVFCRKDFPDNICIEYDMKALSKKGLLITFIAAKGRKGEDIISELPARKGIFADYIHNENMRSYHVSISRYDDNGKHTNTSNWRRNPGLLMMAQQEDLCKEIEKWYHIAIVKKGKLLQMSVNNKTSGGFIDKDEIPEPIPSDGKVGFRIIGADVVVQIKNFKVTALE